MKRNKGTQGMQNMQYLIEKDEFSSIKHLCESLTGYEEAPFLFLPTSQYQPYNNEYDEGN